MHQNGENYFQEQKEWSGRKLKIVRSYLDSFLKILGSSTKQPYVYYVDGFAGKGTYEDGTHGSPLLAIDLAQEYRNKQKKYQLKCINVEENDDNFTNLELATCEYRDIAKNLKGTFASHIDTILNALGRCPALFFIDPFGVKDTNWVDMVKIVHRQAPTDLWLRFDHKTVRRLSGFFDSGSRGADSKVQQLLRFFGLAQANNLFPKLDGKTPEERINNAVNLYVKRLEAESHRAKGYGYSAAFPIISLEGVNKYFLVFAASHQKAVMLANETVYSVERNRSREMQEYQERKTGQLTLLSIEPTETEISKSIEEELATEIWHLCAGEQLSRETIYLRLLRANKSKWFGQFSGSHFNRALSLLTEEHNPRIIGRSGAISQGKTLFTFR